MLRHADISLLNSCNFRCGYCKSSALSVRQNNEVGVYDVNSPVLEADTLINYVRNYLDGYIIQLTGGEPLTHPAFGYILREIAKTNKVIVCTNGELIRVSTRYMNVKNVVWRISYHPEYRRDKFDDVMQYVLSSNVPYIVNYVCHPRHIENGKAIEYIEQVSKYNNEVSEFEGEYKGVQYRLFDEIYEGLRTGLPVRTFGLEMITMRPNGLLYTCHGKVAPIGDMYRGTYDDKSCKMNCHHNGISLCPTYNSLDRIMKYYPNAFGET